MVWKQNIAQVKAGNTFENSLNEICQKLFS